ncbi:MAG: hypothetical protein RL701_1853 [Pseudomonadota bacterium]
MQAQTELSNPEDSWGKTHVLGRHIFLRGSFVPSALVESRVGVRAGIEYHQVPGFAQLPSLVANSAPQAVDLRTLNVAETLDFSIRLHDHVALFGEGYGRARVGANTATLLGTGADYTYGGDLGLLVKLFRIEGFQLSVSGQLGYYAGQSAGILAMFQDLSTIANKTIQDVATTIQTTDPNSDLNQVVTQAANRAIEQLNAAFRVATADLLTPFDGVRYGFAINAAQALGRYFGLQASLGYYADSASYRPTHYDALVGGPVSVEHTVTTTRPSFCMAADFDASPTGVPLALMMEYRVSPVDMSTTDTSGRNVSTVEQLLALGLFYSGRTDLQLGLTGYTVFGQPPALGVNAIPSGKPLDLALQLVFRYYW